MKKQIAATFACGTLILLFGCDSNRTLISPSSTATSEIPPTSANPPMLGSEQARKAAAEKKASEPKDELVEGLNNPAIVGMYMTARNEANRNPSEVNVHVQYIQLIQTIGHERIRANEVDKAYKTFETGGSVARKFAESKPKLTDPARAILAAAFYNEACARSRGQDPAKALASLDDAFQWGFNDVKLLRSDEDLAAVRSLGEFQQRFDLWQQMLHEQLVQKAKSELASGTSFPFDFSLNDVDGKPIKLADYRGKVVIVDIWGTWCPPCRAEIPAFVELQSTYRDKGLQIIGLNQEHVPAEEAPTTIKTFMEENNMNYPCAIIDEATLNQVPNFMGFPTTLFIDRTGKVRLKVVGQQQHAFLEAAVSTLLDESTSETGT